MTMDRSTPLSRLARTAVALEVFLGIGALAGGSALIAGPRGEIIPLKVSQLAGSPFDTFMVPGIVLFVVLGLGPMIAAGLAWLRHPLAPFAAIGVGIALLVWLAVEIAIVGYTNEPPLQPFYLVLGALITAVGLGWTVQAGPVVLRHGIHLR
jgi:hypothetical protein